MREIALQGWLLILKGLKSPFIGISLRTLSRTRCYGKGCYQEQNHSQNYLFHQYSKQSRLLLASTNRPHVGAAIALPVDEQVAIVHGQEPRGARIARVRSTRPVVIRLHACKGTTFARCPLCCPCIIGQSRTIPGKVDQTLQFLHIGQTPVTGRGTVCKVTVPVLKLHAIPHGSVRV